MEDYPEDIAKRLTKYVDDLINARSKDKKLAIKGRTQMILTALEKLREAHKRGKLNSALITQIQNDKCRAGISLPETFENYISFCWDCYRRTGIHVTVDKRVDSVCPSCGWVQCQGCGACRDPKYGHCKDRVYFGPKKKYRGT